MILWLLGACQSPNPRDRPWREPIPQSERTWLAGDGGPGPSLAASEQATLAVRRSERERTLRIHLDADPGSLNPMRAPSVWTRRIMLDTVFETLVRYGPDEDGQVRFQPGLAQRWTVSPDGREIRLALADSATWHDGKPVTALDVQFSLEAAMTKRGGAEHHRRALADLGAVEIVSRSSVRLRLERPNAYILRELANVPIMPEAVYRRALDQRSGTWIGSGPFTVRRAGDNIVLERSESYWGQAPEVPRIEFVRRRDAAIALRDAKEGQMDIIPALIREHYPEQLDIPGVAQNFSVIGLGPPDVSYIVLDTKEAPFDDANARRAIAHLVDRTALIDEAGGLAESVPGLIWPGGPGNAPGPEVPSFDPDEAARLLEAAGWRDDDGDGVRSKESERLMITVLATEGEHAVRDAVLAGIRKAGFVVDLRVGNAAVLRNRLRDGEFDLAFVTWRGVIDRDLSPLLRSGGPSNYGHYESPVVDELLSSIQGAWEPAERTPLLAKLAQLLGRSMPIVALPASAPKGLAHRRVKGLRPWGGWFSLRDLALLED